MKTQNALSQFSVYCGTYLKYNSGSINGDWVDLSDFDNLEDFYIYCAELHSDEIDPEFMFQDWESPVDGLIGESWINEKIFEYAQLDESQFQTYLAYCDAIGSEYATPDKAQERLAGRGSFSDYCYDYFHEQYGDSPLFNYVDWEKIEKDMSFDFSFGDFDGVSYWFYA